jgi:hypothetical protein
VVLHSFYVFCTTETFSILGLDYQTNRRYKADAMMVIVNAAMHVRQNS